MTNGNTLVEHTEKNCERLQTEFLKSKGLCINDYHENPVYFDSLLESQEYADFVLGDMNG